jgi:hypothetical protein
MAFINFDDKHIISLCKIDFLGRWKTILKIRNASHIQQDQIPMQSLNEKRKKCLNKRDFMV